MSPQGTNEVQSNQLNTMATDAPAGDPGSVAVANNDNRKVSREDIELVRRLAVLYSLASWMLIYYQITSLCSGGSKLFQLMKLDILLQVQNLIERCLQLYMTKGEVVRTLSTRARIEPGFTTLGDVANSVADDILVSSSFFLRTSLFVC